MTDASSREKDDNGKEKAINIGDITIGGNATGNVIVSGDHNKVDQKTRHIKTDGGAYIGGNVNIGGGDFVGRDKMTINTNTDGLDELARVFDLIREKANQEKDNFKKEDALEAVEKLKAEAARGEQAEESRVQRWFTFLAEASADAWDVAVTTLPNPVLGLGTAFKKVIQRVREEKAKR